MTFGVSHSTRDKNACCTLNGLMSAEAAVRLLPWGPDVLPTHRGALLTEYLSRFRNPLVPILPGRG
jgi:hypothetical protein